MAIQVKRVGKTLRASLTGELTIYTVAEVKDSLAKAMGKVDEIEVDLFGITEMDTAGLQLLLLIKRNSGKNVSFVNHSSPVMRLVDLANLGGVFGDPLLISEIES